MYETLAYFLFLRSANGKYLDVNVDAHVDVKM